MRHSHSVALLFIFRIYKPEIKVKCIFLFRAQNRVVYKKINIIIFSWYLFKAAGLPYNEELVVASSINIRPKGRNEIIRQKRQFGGFG